MSQNPGVGASSGASQLVNTKNPLTALSPTTATVTGTSTQVIAADALRMGCSIINLSTDIIYLAFGANPAVVNDGIALTQKGSVYEMSEYDYTLSSINAISSGTSSVISIQQWH